ncbi:hypothetical protein BPT24_077 [Tenacibaculum phage pT24]|uniref:Pyrophosphatase n=1 Tax=Tenacibaculum phage pT24 TaxID=1880590 RepID=A0A1B4XWM1_9CAUD|nr:MazG-like pyrophosphatase [Tenacibaculum phage pT24]BAV39202.1 hypothetical protein BPT24_077 [Tenacibaculum phage pT24]
MMIGDILENFKSFSNDIKDRHIAGVALKLNEEVGELSTEIAIDLGMSYKEAGKDGVVGEAIDAINCLLDIILLNKPDITADELNQIQYEKLKKWHDKCRK